VNCLFLFKIDVALELLDSLGLVEWLSKATGSGEGVGTSSSTHVSVLTLQSFSVDSDGSSLSVVTLRHSRSKLIISGLLGASVDAVLNDQSVVAGFHWHKLTVLGSHNLAADHVGSQVLLVVSILVSGVKVAHLTQLFLFTLLLSNLSSNGLLDLSLEVLLFTANSGNAVSSILRGSILMVVGRHQFGTALSINTVGGAVEGLSLDGLLKVQVSLRNMLSHNSSIKYKKEL